MKEKIKTSPAGNRTPVSRVTGGDTHHYTTEESDDIIFSKFDLKSLNSLKVAKMNF